MRPHSLMKLRGWYQKLHGTVLPCLRLSSSLCVAYNFTLSQMLKCLSCQPFRQPTTFKPWHLMRAIHIPVGRHFERSNPTFEKNRVSSYTLETQMSSKVILIEIQPAVFLSQIQRLPFITLMKLYELCSFTSNLLMHTRR